jgi:hypothetical protein
MSFALLAPIAAQLITSAIQKGNANKLENEYDRPAFPLPQAYLDAVDLNKNMALQTGLPRQDLIDQKLDQSSANALEGVKSGATSSWDVTGAANKLAGLKSEKINDISIAGANFNRGARSDYTSLLEGLSQLQERKFMMDEYKPYLAAMDAIKNSREASTQNMYSGVSNLASVIENAIGKNQDSGEDIFSGLKGNKRASGYLEGNFAAVEDDSKYKAPQTAE